LKVEACVLWASALSGDELRAKLFRYAVEVGLVVRRGQALGEALPSG
jgi:hypothetical protein